MADQSSLWNSTVSPDTSASVCFGSGHLPLRQETSKVPCELRVFGLRTDGADWPCVLIISALVPEVGWFALRTASFLTGVGSRADGCC